MTDQMRFEDEAPPKSEAEARAIADRILIQQTAEKVERMSAGVAETQKQSEEKIRTAMDAFTSARKEEDEKRAEFRAKLDSKIEAWAARQATPPAQTQPKPKFTSWSQFVHERLNSDDLKRRIELCDFDKIGKGEIPKNLINAACQYADQAAVMRFDDPTMQTLSQLAGATPNAYQYNPIWEGFLSRPFSSEVPSMELQAATLVYPREAESSRLSAIRTHLTSQTESGSAVLVVQSTAGMFVGQILHIFSTTHLEKVILTVDSTTQVTCTATMGETVADNTIVASQEYCHTAEGGSPPYTLIKSSTITATMYGDKVLHGMTREAMVYQNLLSILQERMPRYAAASLSWKLLYYSTLNGLMTVSGAQEWNWSDGVVGDTMADAVVRAWALIRTDGMKKAWCHVSDFISMATAKEASGDGGYIQTTFGPMPISLGESGLRVGWIPFGLDHSFASGNFLLIDHAAAHSLLRDSRLTGFDVGYMDSDFGIGELHARYWQQVGQMIKALGAFVVCDWDSAPS
jgi:hypothetical protein